MGACDNPANRDGPPTLADKPVARSWGARLSTLSFYYPTLLSRADASSWRCCTPAAHHRPARVPPLGCAPAPARHKSPFCRRRWPSRAANHGRPAAPLRLGAAPHPRLALRGRLGRRRLGRHQRARRRFWARLVRRLSPPPPAAGPDDPFRTAMYRPRRSLVAGDRHCHAAPSIGAARAGTTSPQLARIMTCTCMHTLPSYGYS